MCWQATNKPNNRWWDRLVWRITDKMDDNTMLSVWLMAGVLLYIIATIFGG